MLEKQFIERLKQENTEVFLNEPMKNHTTFRIGGEADCLCEVRDIRSLKAVLALCREYHVPFFVLGMGSNLLVSDKGIEGLVIQLGRDFNEVIRAEDNVIRAGAGCTLAKVCLFAKNMSLSGLEFAWGIPGSVGGAVYMNAGAYNGEIRDVAVSVDYMDAEGNVRRMRQEELDFSHRHSAFTDTDHVILSASFQLTPASQDQISERMQELMNRRKDKQPINHPSAGSIFKRPEGAFAAALIEQCGLKGYAVGGAEVSEKHAGFIVNDRNATAKDVLSLIEHIKKVVKEQKNIDLTCEIRFIGRK